MHVLTHLLNYGFQFLLLAAWLGLTGLKVYHYLSEPTALQSRLDHKFKPPYISVMPWTVPSRIKNVIKNGTEQERMELFGNQTLLDFYRSYGLALAEYAGITNMTDDERRQKINQTTIKDHNGIWKQTVALDQYMGATLAPSLPVMLTLPRNAESYSFLGSQYVFFVMFHSDPEIWMYDPAEHSYLPVRNVSQHRDVRISVERHINLNLRRLPCEENPNNTIAVCQRKCFLESMNCSIEGDDRNGTGGKPMCMASDYTWYMKQLEEFRLGNNATDEAPISKCPCRPSCVQDRVSYTALSDTTKSTNDSLRMYITISRVRHTRLTVLTYGLEDLLADIGGYLGLLLGVSLHSLCGAGHRLARRLTKRVRQRRDGAQPATGLRDASGAESAWSLERDEAASELCQMSPKHDLRSRHRQKGASDGLY